MVNMVESAASWAILIQPMGSRYLCEDSTKVAKVSNRDNRHLKHELVHSLYLFHRKDQIYHRFQDLQYPVYDHLYYVIVWINQNNIYQFLPLEYFRNNRPLQFSEHQDRSGSLMAFFLTEK